MPEYVYDVALSFAGTERTYVEGVRTELARWGRSVFYDEDEVVALWGTNLLESLGDIYLNQARYTVMFISAGYANSHWTRHERRMALARALIQREPYVLPVRFDDTSLDGLDPGVAYIPVGEMQPADLARLIVQKLVTAPPPEDDIDQAAGWEYLLFVDELEAGVNAQLEARRDHRLGFSTPRTGSRLEGADVTAFISARVAEAEAWMANLMRALDPSTQEGAFGAPGEPGNADAIRHLARMATDCYVALIQWAQNIRGQLVQTEARELLDALAEYVTQSIENYEAFVNETASRLRSVVSQIRSDPEVEGLVVQISYVADIPTEVTERFSGLLRAFSAVVGT